MQLHSMKAMCRQCAPPWIAESYFSDELEAFAEYHIKRHPGHIIDFITPS